MEEMILEEITSASDMFERTYERTNDLDFHYASITYGVNKETNLKTNHNSMKIRYRDTIRNWFQKRYR